MTIVCNIYKGVLHFQLKHIPKDFFVDIVSKDNFLTVTLKVSIVPCDLLINYVVHHT